MRPKTECPISVLGLTKYYGKKKGVEDISFNVFPGEIVGFLGPNGSGKTTVMRMLVGLIHPTAGSVQIFGEEVSTTNFNIRSTIGYLPGNLGLYKNMTVIDYLLFLSKLRRRDCNLRIHELLQRFSVSPDTEISSLSKGTKQKVGVIQALMHSPKILILDEPTSGLDPIVQKEFQLILREERSKGVSILLSSHVMNEIDDVADRVIILLNGHLVVVDTVEALKSRTTKTLRLEFPDVVNGTIFMDIPEVRSVHIDGRFVDCVVTGPETALLTSALQHHLISVVSQEPTLEEIFLLQTESANA